MSWHAQHTVPVARLVEDVANAYAIRVDDAYALAHVCRGVLRSKALDATGQRVDHVDPEWSAPGADARRFLAAGAARGALPAWWDDASTADCVALCEKRAGRLQPLAILDAGGAAKLEFYRLIADEMEGAPAWAAQPHRDASANRFPEKTPNHRCQRCLGNMSEFTNCKPHFFGRRVVQTHRTGPDEYACPFCDYEGECPKCVDGAVERGRCTSQACGYRPALYRAVLTVNGDVARRGCALGAQLLPSLRDMSFYATNGTPHCWDTAKLLDVDRLRARGMPMSNVGSHLSETTDPEMVTLMEASVMLDAGVRIGAVLLRQTKADIQREGAAFDYRALVADERLIDDVGAFTACRRCAIVASPRRRRPAAPALPPPAAPP